MWLVILEPVDEEVTKIVCTHAKERKIERKLLLGGICIIKHPKIPSPLLGETRPGTNASDDWTSKGVGFGIRRRSGLPRR